MATVTKRLYEGLFLVDSGDAARDWDGVVGAVKKALARGEAELVSFNKWDERRFTYEIQGRSRGTYILTYFNGTPGKIGAIEREVQLSERLLRVLMLRTDKMSQEDMDRVTPTMIAEASAEAAEAAAAAKVEAAEKAAEEVADAESVVADDDVEESAGVDDGFVELADVDDNDEPDSDVTAEKQPDDVPDGIVDVSVDADDSENQ